MQVRVCLDGECTTETLTRQGPEAVSSPTMVLFDQTLFFEPPSGITPGSHVVSVQVTREAKVVVEVERELVAEGFNPNGATCAAACVWATFAL